MRAPGRFKGVEVQGWSQVGVENGISVCVCKKLVSDEITQDVGCGPLGVGQVAQVKKEEYQQWHWID